MLSMGDAKVKIGEFRNQVSAYISRAERGEMFSILRRNREVARLEPAPRGKRAPKGLLGSMQGTASVRGDILGSIRNAGWFSGR